MARKIVKQKHSSVVDSPANDWIKLRIIALDNNETFDLLESLWIETGEK